MIHERLQVALLIRCESMSTSGLAICLLDVILQCVALYHIYHVVCRTKIHLFLITMSIWIQAVMMVVVPSCSTNITY